MSFSMCFRSSLELDFSHIRWSLARLRIIGLTLHTLRRDVDKYRINKMLLLSDRVIIDYGVSDFISWSIEQVILMGSFSGVLK